MTMIAMIPARMGSQRLPKKNLAPIDGVPLITQAIRKCKAAGLFDEIWVNSEHPAFGEIAEAEGVHFHQRPEALGDNAATSEDFVAEFLENHDCEFVVQVHSIAPLLSVPDMSRFLEVLGQDAHDGLMSVVEENLECLYRGSPVNFTFDEKTNSQDLTPIQRIVWAITAWRRSTFLEALAEGRCATYSGRIGYVPVGRMAGHVIKTQEDLDLAQALYAHVHG
ncbi:acylneuraminate cytidylyltransferase family protein [Alterinioella nitratireducens]|uniref:acylneuraminate cytidylyltransferase family protein n=1 Tax=Alterinioella nitratireducens TaxID=2735915 RepID=UPI001552DFB5|nr:NTP transferase domain-containing protein [Alterinioella nitratireducens]NPD21288.1 NTP transferase domain-containing protein [Alterinioella nitratireducens]